KDVLGAGEQIRRAQRALVLVLSVRAHAVRRAVQQNGIGVGLRGVLGDVHRREQPLPVAHGDAELVFAVVGLDPVGEFPFFRLTRFLRLLSAIAVGSVGWNCAAAGAASIAASSSTESNERR